MDKAEAVSALPWLCTSSRTCISSFLPSNLSSHCKRITVSALSSLLKVKIRQVNQAPYNSALRSFLSHGGRLKGHSKTYWRLHSGYVLPGRHWDAPRMDEPMNPNEDMNMKTASPCLKSRLCYTPQQYFPWLQHTRFNKHIKLLFPKALRRKLLLFCVVYLTTLRKLINPPDFWLKINM